VQLRRSANGESSGTVADCLAAGVVPIVSDVGTGRDLPADAVVRIGPAATVADLAAAVVDLLADPARRTELASAGRAYAATHSHAALARRLFDEVILPASQTGLTVPRLR
jgi:glycosyltransferase involved in cell wall biosynthesis